MFEVKQIVKQYRQKQDREREKQRNNVRRKELGRDTDIVYSAYSSWSGLITFYCFTHKSVISHIQHSGHCNKRTPAEVIHHQCNTLLSLSLLFLLYLHHYGGLLVSPSLVLSLCLCFSNLVSLISFPLSAPSLSQFLHAKVSVPSHLTDFQRQHHSLGPDFKVSSKLSRVISGKAF